MVRRFLAGLAMAAFAAVPVSAQTADDLIARNLQAKGGLEKIKSVQTLRMTGRMPVGPGIRAPFVLELKRPNQMRMEVTHQGTTGIQAFDGKSGWQVVPFGGRRGPEPLPPEAVRQVQEQADFDGPLVDYRAKGHKVEYVGKETVGGTEVYKLKVTLKSGDVRTIFLDAERYLEIGGEATAKMGGTEVEVETTIGDYREVDGLLLPHLMESGRKGSPQKMTTTLDKIEVNVPLDDARFRMPTGK